MATHIATRLVLVLVLFVLPVGVTVFQKAQGSVLSNPIKMKFDKNVLQLNTKSMDGVGFPI